MTRVRENANVHTYPTNKNKIEMLMNIRWMLKIDIAYYILLEL